MTARPALSGSLCGVCQGEAVDAAYLCGRCTASLERDLGDAGAYSAELRTTRLRQSRTGGGGVGVVSRVHDKPLPWDQHAAEVADALHATLVGWARVVIEERGVTSPADTDQALASFLLRHLDWVRHQRFAPETVDEVGDAVGRARAAVDTRAELAYNGPCRATFHPDGDPEVAASCLAELYVRSGAAHVRCRACDAEHDVALRHRWLLDQVRDQLATASQLSRALSSLGLALPVETLRSWVKRERLLPHGVDLQGRALYSVGEAADLLVSSSQRRRSA